MRASELLGLPVTGPGGGDLGRVLDVRLVQEGALRGNAAALRVEGFVVGHHELASRLGYDRYERPGPAMVRHLVARLARRNGYLAWDEAELSDDGVRATVSELPAVPLL
jgi:hypothetical protein